MISKARVDARDDLPLTVLEISGEVTTFAEQAIVDAYERATERGAKMILLDFSNVSYVNSAGISVIIGLVAQARERDQQILVSGLSEHYTRVFHIMGLESYVQLFDDKEQARQSVRARG